MNHANNSVEGWVWLVAVVAILVLLARRRHWVGSKTAHGTARFAEDADLKQAGMLEGRGLVVARSATSGRLIFLPHYCHVLLVGGTGSGKGVSVIIPTLLSYFKGACICFDTKNDLHATTANRRRAAGERIIRLSPFGGGKDAFNPLDCIKPGPLLVDQARALAESLVVRLGTEPDPHWNENSVMVICGVLVYVLIFFRSEDRNLNSVREITSDPVLLDVACEQLRAFGGIPARMGHQIAGLESKEKSGVMSTVGRHLAFLDSELVAASLALSTFEVADLLKPGTTLFLQIPPDQLEAQKGLLRCWISTLVREIGRAGSESSGETLFLIDEASALGSLAAVEEALNRGRSAGVRMLLAYQSDSQVESAFPGKPTLLYDNASVHLYLGASGYATAEKISKRIGEQTITVEGASANDSRSWQEGGLDTNSGGINVQEGGGTSQSVMARLLLKPEEVLTLGSEFLFVFVRSMPPILCLRLLWYADPAFAEGATEPRLDQPIPWWGWLMMAASGAMFIAFLAGW